MIEIAIANPPRLNLISILKEDRNLTIDKLAQIKALLIKNSLQSSSDFNSQLPELLIVYIEKMMKMHKLNFQFTLELFLYCFILFLQCESDSRKLSESVYKLFYSILVLPVQIKDRKYLLSSDPIYLNFSDPVKLDKQDEAQKKIMFLLKCILEASTHTFHNKDLVYKIYGLAKKAAEKEFGHLFINIFIPFYLSKIQATLSNSEQHLLHLHQIANILMLKFKYQTHQVIEKIIKWCPGDKLPVLLTYLLLECILRKQNILFYANFLLHEHTLNSIKQHYSKLIESEVNLCQIPFSVIITLPTKLSLQSICLLLIGCVFARSYESPQIFSEFVERLRNALKPFDLCLDDLYDKILLQIYLHGFQLNMNKIEINPYKIIKVFKSYKHALLPFFIARDNVQSLTSFINQVTKILQPIEIGYLFEELDDLGQLILIINAVKDNPVNFQSSTIQLLIQYHIVRKNLQLSNELIFYSMYSLTLIKNIQAIHNPPYSKYILQWLGNSQITQFMSRIPLHQIAHTQRSLIDHYFNENNISSIDNTIMNLLQKLSSTEESMNSLIDYLFKFAMQYDPTFTSVIPDTQFSHLSSALFEQIGITITPNTIKRTEKEFVTKAITLIEFLLPSAQSAIKKAIAFYLDNLSDLTIKDIILPNRFLLRCMIYSSKSKFKNLLETVLRCENKQEYLQILFPDQTPLIRLQYSKFLIQRITTLEFRIFLSDFQQFLSLADSKQPK